MTDALVKAISFITFIVIGLVLKKKFTSKDEINGLKKIILLLALPATIFIALLKIKLNLSFIFLPLFAIAFNLFLYAITPTLLLVLGITNKSIVNTSKLLIPSLAPGLSCFPFILEFLGDSYIAKAAMADLGNKFFVLFILYLLAIKWYYRNNNTKQEPILTKLKSLGKVMLLEPVNLFIIAALIFVCCGISMSDLPLFIQGNLYRLSDIMTPLVLLFIGLAVAIKRTQFTQIFSLLMLRYGLTLLIMACLIAIFNFLVKDDILFMIAFGLSACSFWPFAHISSIASKEIDMPLDAKTFDIDFALSILALSLQLSVILILGVFTAGDTFTNFQNVLMLSLSIIFLGILLPLYKRAKHGAQIKKKYSQIKE
jgi:malate permease and related proteins